MECVVGSEIWGGGAGWKGFAQGFSDLAPPVFVGFLCSHSTARAHCIVERCDKMKWEWMFCSMLKILLLFYRYSSYQKARKACGSFFFSVCPQWAHMVGRRSRWIWDTKVGGNVAWAKLCGRKARWFVITTSEGFGQSGANKSCRVCGEMNGWGW